jgi:RNA recognition motif-containing protein
MGTRLYVGNLSYDSTEAGLRAAFEADGRQVSEVALIMDRETGRPKGFAFIQMGSEQDAKAAIAALDGKEVGGRAIRVSEAQERPAGGRSGGGGGRGGYGGGGRGGSRY